MVSSTIEASRLEGEDGAQIVSRNSPTMSKVLRANEAVINNIDLQTSSVEMLKSLDERRKNDHKHPQGVVVIIVVDAHPKIAIRLMICNIKLSGTIKNTLKSAKIRGSRATNRQAACSTRPKSDNTSTWCSMQMISLAEEEANATKNLGLPRIWALVRITSKMIITIKWKRKLNSTRDRSSRTEIKPR